MRQAFSKFQSIAETTTIALAREMGDPYPEARFRGAFSGWSRLQVNYSRPSQVDLPMINESHEDGDFFTVLCAMIPDLELMIAGSFQPVLLQMLLF